MKVSAIETTPTPPRAMWPSGLEVRSAVASSRFHTSTSRMGKMAKKERKKTICPAGSCPDALISEDMATKIATEVTLRPMARSTLPEGPTDGEEEEEVAISRIVPAAGHFRRCERWAFAVRSGHSGNSERIL